ATQPPCASPGCTSAAAPPEAKPGARAGIVARERRPGRLDRGGQHGGGAGLGSADLPGAGRQPQEVGAGRLRLSRSGAVGRRGQVRRRIAPWGGSFRSNSGTTFRPDNCQNYVQSTVSYSPQFWQRRGKKSVPEFVP